MHDARCTLHAALHATRCMVLNARCKMRLSAHGALRAVHADRRRTQDARRMAHDARCTAHGAPCTMHDA
eukprot:1049228-Lingulodinium_polyedra.AAC.1